MKTILFVALTCGQVLAATQNPTYENEVYNDNQSHSTVVENPNLRKKKNGSNAVVKTCAVVGAAALGFLASSIGCMDSGPRYDAEPFVAAGVVGAVTYICLTFPEGDEN